MIQIQNVTASLALSDERARLGETAAAAAGSSALPLDSGESNDSPVSGPPHEHVPVVHLPSKESITKALKEERDREVGSAKHQSAVANMPAASHGSAIGTSVFAVLGDALAARALNPQPLPPRAGSPAQLNDPLAAAGLNPQPLPPREAMRSIAQFDGGEINARLAAAGLNPQPLPPGDPLQDFDKPAQMGRIR
jgi:hypothetical protein